MIAISKALNKTGTFLLSCFRTVEMSSQNTVENVKGLAKLSKQAKSCIDVIKIGTNLCQILTSLLRKLCCYGKSIPCVGSFLAIVERMLPVEGSKSVIRLLQKLSEQINAELESKINWAAIKLQYCDIATKIETGMEYLSKLLESVTDDERTRYEERLKALCSNETMTIAVRNLVKALAPGEDLLQNDILESIYPLTRGHRGKFDSLCKRFLQLFVGGVAVILFYETLVRGEEAASEMNTLFDGDAEKLMRRFEAFRKRYKDCFRENMVTDLNEVIDGEMSNKDAVKYLSNLLREKYDWLETYSIVCKESMFIDYDFTGDHVKSLERKNRFGVIFYREIPEGTAIRYSTTSITHDDSRLEQIRNIINGTGRAYWLSDAARINSVLDANFRQGGISVWGCATLKIRRISYIPIVYLPAAIASDKALSSFEASVETGETSEAVIVYSSVKHMHLCLVHVDRFPPLTSTEDSLGPSSKKKRSELEEEKKADVMAEEERWRKSSRWRKRRWSKRLRLKKGIMWI